MLRGSINLRQYATAFHDLTLTFILMALARMLQDRALPLCAPAMSLNESRRLVLDAIEMACWLLRAKLRTLFAKNKTRPSQSH